MCVRETTTRCSTYTSRFKAQRKASDPAHHHQHLALQHDPARLSLTSILEQHMTTVLPTTLILFDTGKKSFETRAIIDPCCPLSRIDASLATAFGHSVSRVGTEKACSLVVRSEASDFRRSTGPP
ncbi:hypothetical protein ACLKA7_000220 [Drosophila subpalustris]